MSILSSIGGAISSAYNSVKNYVTGNSQTASVMNFPIQTGYNTGLNTYPGFNAPSGTKSTLALPTTASYNSSFMSANPQYNYSGYNYSAPTPTPTSYSSGTKIALGGNYLSGGGSNSSNYSSPSYSPNFSGFALAPQMPTSTKVSASTIGSGTPSVVMPSAPSSTNYHGDIAGANVGVGANPQTGLIETGTTGTMGNQSTEEQTAKKTFDDFMSTLKAPPSEADSYNRALRESGVEQARQQRQNTQNAINSVTTQMNTDLLNLRGTAAKEGVVEAVYGGQQAEVTREATIKLLPLQAQLASDQGNLSLAEEHLNTLFSIYSKDAQNSVDYYNANVKAVYEFMTTAQKKKADAITKQKDFVAGLVKDEINNQQANATQALKDGNMSLYKALTSIRPPINVNSPTFDKDMNKYRTDLSNAIQRFGQPAASTVTNPQYAGVLNTILGSGKFTKPQVQAVTNAINSGEDPFTVVKNQAKGIMGQNEATTVTKYETAQSALADLRNALTDYYAADGKTNVFKGNYEKTLNKLGTLEDAKLVELGTQIQAQLQVYRNAVSGTAYSVQEGQDINAIFPGINKTQGLNAAIINGRMKAFDSTIDGTYKAVLGSAYDNLKSLKTATQKQQAQVPKGFIVTAPDKTKVLIVN